MVKIRKDGQTTTVPVSAFKKIYEPAGWVAVKKSKAQKPAEEPKTEIQDGSEYESEDLKTLDELVTLEQLKDFALEKGVDVEGLTTRKSVRNAIKTALTVRNAIDEAVTAAQTE